MFDFKVHANIYFYEQPLNSWDSMDSNSNSQWLSLKGQFREDGGGEGYAVGSDSQSSFGLRSSKLYVQYSMVK